MSKGLQVSCRFENSAIIQALFFSTKLRKKINSVVTNVLTKDCYVIFFCSDWSFQTGQLQCYWRSCCVNIQIYRENAKMFHYSDKRKLTLWLCKAKEIAKVEKGIFSAHRSTSLICMKFKRWRQTNFCNYIFIFIIDRYRYYPTYI